jgi:hypothetical protein
VTLSLLASGIVKFLRGPVAQLDRANGYEPLGREFESLRAHHFLPVISISSETEVKPNRDTQATVIPKPL